jgi:hypothetical protein
MKNQMLKVSVLIIVALLSIGSIVAQDSNVIRMKMEEMEKSPQNLMTMTYRHNVMTFAESLRDMSKGGKLDDLEMARMTLSEIKRNMAKMEESHLLHMQTMTAEMNEIMFPQMEKMQAENVLVKEHIVALEKALQASAPNASDVNKHTAEIVLILEKSHMSEMKDSEMKGDKMTAMTTPTPTPMPDKMKGMKSTDKSSQDSSMSDNMMRAAGLIPHGIMVGKAGRTMVSYHFMYDNLKGNLIGTKRLSTAEVLARFETAPTDMKMQMHMFMVMHSFTDKLTLMAMIPYTKMSMGEVHRDGTRSTERSQGFGDVELRANYVLYARDDFRHRFLLNAGIGLPTGSINRLDDEGERHEYGMQIGSGTFSVIPGVTYLGQAVPWGWGAEIMPTIRLGRNKNGYRLGNRFQPSFWGGRQMAPWISLIARFDGDIWGNIKGADPTLDPAAEPTKDPLRQGGKRLDFTFRTDVHPAEGILMGHSFFIDLVKPVYQSLNGPQLERRWAVRLGWHYEF